MKPRVRIFLLSGVLCGFGAVSLVSHAGAHGRHIDQFQPGRVVVPSETAVSGSTYVSRQPYAGRRIDHPQVVFETRAREQAELAAFEAEQSRASTDIKRHIGRGPR